MVYICVLAERTKKKKKEFCFGFCLDFDLCFSLSFSLVITEMHKGGGGVVVWPKCVGEGEYNCMK